MAGMEDAGPELALRKLTQTFGVRSYVILNKNGIPVQSYGMEEQKANQYAGIFSELALSAQNFLEKDKRHIDPEMGFDEELGLQCLRLRTYKNEYIICPEKDYCLIVVHNPNYVQPDVPEVAAGGEEGEGGEGGGGTRPGTSA
jgi:hypothetical protein